MEEKNVKGNFNEVDKLVEAGLKALEEFRFFDQEKVDKIVYHMTLAGIENHMRLAKMAVEETGRGVYEDKIIKNLFSTESIYHNIKKQKTCETIDENEMEGYIEVAEPVGVIAGVTPVTNPTSTTMFKALISAKTRNPIIFAFHPSSQNCSAESARVLYEAGIKAGAPRGFIQWIENPSVEATNALMAHSGVSLILATGGNSMVKAAYSCGKPALGVGAGNVPCYIEKSANIERACTDLIISKTFDNGMICASEQAVIVDKALQKDFERIMKAHNCYFLNDEETQKISQFVMPNGKLNSKVVGQTAAWIAEGAGIKVDSRTKILIAKIKDVGEEYALSKEKLSPVLAYLLADGTEQGFNLCEKMLALGGMGHSAVIHSNNDVIIKRFGEEMNVGRVLVNSPSSQGGIGDIYNANIPSLTLGCGSFGKNSTTSNVSTVNLINKKRLALRKVNMQWFKIPPKIYFEHGAIGYLEKMKDITRAFIVTDETMIKLGYIDRALYHLRKRNIYCHSEIFSAVEPDPSTETIKRGVAEMNRFKPDVIIALGGGSAIDAAKGMWLFYEQPDTDFDGLKLKFLDIRKRAFSFPKLGAKAKFVAIPTTSGTGSEVTSFTVITDKQNGNIKYPLADYSLTPDVAIIDPQFTYSVPKSITADTGVDVLTHAIEAYVSVLASDYTDGLAMKAIELVFDYLPKAYENGDDKLAREKMHNASCIAGMAFTNAFLGVNHSVAHKLGGEFHIPHGRANAILLPRIIEYNAEMPTKITIFPKYERYIAHEKYAEIAKHLGIAGKTVKESVSNLINAIRELMKKVNMPMSISECGIDRERYMSMIPQIADRALEDQCTTANPRLPLLTELEQILRDIY